MFSFKNLLRSSFLKHAMVLGSGTAIAQAIAIGFLPVLTRLFTPEDFGVLTLYISIVSLLFIFSTFRYEIMIMLPHSNKAAAQIVRLIFFISLTTSLLSFVAVLFFGNQIAKILGNPDVAPWLYFLPISLFFQANYQALRYWFMRLQKFGTVSQGVVIKASTNLISASSIKLSAAPLPAAGGLVIGTILADILSAFWLFFKCSDKRELYFLRTNKTRLAVMTKRHRSMAATLTFSHGIAVVNSRLPVFMISAFFGSAALGYFGLAERIANAPSQLIAGAIGDVYRQRASVLYRETGRFDKLMLKTLLMTFMMAIIPYTIGILFAPDIFRIAFGAEWEEAGRYASIIMIGGFFAFVITPIDKGAIIVGAKTYILTWHILRLTAKLLTLGALFLLGFSIYELLWIIVIIRISLYLFDLGMEYNYAKKGK